MNRDYAGFLLANETFDSTEKMTDNGDVNILTEKKTAI